VRDRHEVAFSEREPEDEQPADRAQGEELQEPQDASGQQEQTRRILCAPPTYDHPGQQVGPPTPTMARRSADVRSPTPSDGTRPRTATRAAPATPTRATTRSSRRRARGPDIDEVCSAPPPTSSVHAPRRASSTPVAALMPRRVVVFAEPEPSRAITRTRREPPDDSNRGRLATRRVGGVAAARHRLGASAVHRVATARPPHTPGRVDAHRMTAAHRHDQQPTNTRRRLPNRNPTPKVDHRQESDDERQPSCPRERHPSRSPGVPRGPGRTSRMSRSTLRIGLVALLTASLVGSPQRPPSQRIPVGRGPGIETVTENPCTGQETTWCFTT
jgi:hypothetical protein